MLNEYYLDLFPQDAGLEALGQLCTLNDIICISCDKNYENVSNGDEITINVTLNDTFSEKNQKLKDVEDALKIHLENTSLTFKADGLEDAKSFDVFDNVTDHIVFEGANGTGNAHVDFPNNFEFENDGFYFSKVDYTNNELNVVYDNKTIGNITYNIKSDSKLFKGEKYTINAEMNETLKEFLNEKNM